MKLLQQGSDLAGIREAKELAKPPADEPRQTRVSQGGPAEQLAPSADPELAGLSTGSSSLLAGEEVAPCPA